MNIPRYKASKPMQTVFITNADSCGDHIFTQLKREGNVAIYYRTNCETNKVVGYEVIVISTVKAGTVYVKGGKPTEQDSESYPGAKSFGKSAWFCVNIKQAEEKFNELVKDQSVVEVPKSPIENESQDIPDGEFTQSDFATTNCLPPKGIVYNILKSLITSGKIKVVKTVQKGPGRPTNIYKKV